MKLTEFYETLTRYIGDRYAHEKTVCIPHKMVGSIGGTPVVNVKSINSGFDWDNGKFMLMPEKELRLVDADEYNRTKKHYDQLGWDIYENGNLKRENKKLKKKIEELEATLKEINHG